MNSFKFDSVNINNTVKSLGQLLLKYYIHPDIANDMNISLLKRLSEDDYCMCENGFTLAKRLTNELQELSNDKHLNVTFSESSSALPKYDSISDKSLLLRQKLNNYGFERVERLPGNIGYIVLNEFAYPEYAGETASYAMSFISGTDALIIDLRNNYGGSAFMSTLIASYLLEGSPPVHLNDIYWRLYDKTQSFWSLPFVPGKRFGAIKPVFILTSQNTGSCAEEFAYSLQAIHRVKIVGEKTAGMANAGSVHCVNEHFQTFIPNAYPINPITKSSWDVTGVLPDIQCKSNESFEKAYQLLLEHLNQKFGEEMEPGREHLVAEIKRIIKNDN